jgi:hypothetical protein
MKTENYDYLEKKFGAGSVLNLELPGTKSKLAVRVPDRIPLEENEILVNANILVHNKEIYRLTLYQNMYSNYDIKVERLNRSFPISFDRMNWADVEYGSRSLYNRVSMWMKKEVENDKNERKSYSLFDGGDVTDDFLKKDVAQNWLALEYVKDQSPELCMAAVKQDGYALKYVKEQTPELCMAAVKQNGYALQFVKEQTLELCMEAVQEDGSALRFVKEQTPELCMAAVKRSGWVLEFVKDQSPELCMAAVKKSGYALRVVKEQTPELCMTAVKRSGYILRFVKEQTPEICMEAVKQDGWALEFVKEQTPELCVEAVKKTNGRALRFVKEQTPEICLEAIKQDGYGYQYINFEKFEIPSKISNVKLSNEQRIGLLKGETIELKDVFHVQNNKVIPTMTVRRELDKNGEYQLKFSTKNAQKEKEVVANKSIRIPALKPRSKGIKM